MQKTLMNIFFIESIRLVPTQRNNSQALVFNIFFRDFAHIYFENNMIHYHCIQLSN